MKRFAALILMLSMLLLWGCGSSEETPLTYATTTTLTTAPTTTAPTTTAPTTTVPTTEPEPIPDPEPVPEHVNPLTGEELAEPYMNRIYAVVIEDDKRSLPHWGVSNADMLWEMPHEGGITRMVAMFTDVAAVEKVGPNRSARPYLISLAQSFDAIFVHAGGSTQAYKDFKSTGWNHIDGVKGQWDHFFRDKDRRAQGVALEHTMYTTGAEILEATGQEGFKTSRGEEVNYGYLFAEDGTPADGVAAQNIDLRFQKDGKKTSFRYDAEAGKYTVYQYDRDYTDGNNGVVVPFENVIVIETDWGVLNSYGALTVDLIDEGDGWFACNGQAVQIRWSRGATGEPISFTLADGTPLTLGTGTTYVAVIRNGAPVTIS